MNRFDRITAILIQLQSRKIVKAQDLSDRFEVSLRTIYRDINSLAEAGVPIAGEAGVGYSIMEGYRLPPVMFTREEARTFITAEKLMEKFTDQKVRSHYQSAMFKIKSVLRTSEKTMVETLENHIEIRQNYQIFPGASENSLDVLLKSISDKKAVVIRYTAINAEVPTERTVEPVGVFHENNFWYTIAYCHLRNGYRNFRLDRINSIDLTEKSFDLQHAPLKDFLNQKVQEGQNMHLLVIRIQKKMAAYVQHQKYYYGFVSEVVTGDEIEMTFLTEYLGPFARWYLMLAPNATVLSPPELTVEIRKLIEEISQKI